MVMQHSDGTFPLSHISLQKYHPFYLYPPGDVWIRILILAHCELIDCVMQ